MSKEVFIVTGGFFDGTSEGYIGKISLDKNEHGTSLNFETSIITEPPSPELRVKNKGFAGGSIHGDLLWLCSANQVLAYSLDDFQLKHVIDDPLFNDLHHVLAENDGLYVVNTGLESLDYFGYDGQLKERKLLTSEERTQSRLSSSSEFRIIDSKPHFMHANHCSRRPDGHIILTFVRQRRIVDTTDWSWASPEYPAPPHEGFIANYSFNNQDCLWVTTVPGDIIACDPSSGKIISKWNLAEKNIPPGWTRGLCVLEHGMLVGTTKIRASSADYYSRWSQQDLTNSCTSISYIPFDETEDVTMTEVLDERCAKIFSILPMA